MGHLEKSALFLKASLTVLKNVALLRGRHCTAHIVHPYQKFLQQMKDIRRVYPFLDHSSPFQAFLNDPQPLPRQKHQLLFQQF